MGKCQSCIKQCWCVHSFKLHINVHKKLANRLLQWLKFLHIYFLVLQVLAHKPYFFTQYCGTHIWTACICDVQFRYQKCFCLVLLDNHSTWILGLLWGHRNKPQYRTFWQSSSAADLHSISWLEALKSYIHDMCDYNPQPYVAVPGRIKSNIIPLHNSTMLQRLKHCKHKIFIKSLSLVCLNLISLTRISQSSIPTSFYTQLHSSVEIMQGWGFVSLPSLLHYPYHVWSHDKWPGPAQKTGQLTILQFTTECSALPMWCS